MDDYSSRVNKIVGLLEDKAFWERRVEGLKLLRRMFAEDLSTLGHDAAVPILNTIRIPLKAQLEDLRSQICKDACACVTELAKSTITDRAVWEHASDWFLQPLLHASCNTIAIISHSAMDCLRSIATVGRLNRHALNAIVAACTHKHNVIRRNAFECLLMTLHTVDIAHLHKVLATVQRVVRGGMSDPLQEARKLARLCFWGLERVHEDSAVVLYEGLAPNIQRSIDGDKAAYDGWAVTFGGLAASVMGAGGYGGPLGADGAGGGGVAVNLADGSRPQARAPSSAVAATPARGAGGAADSTTVVMSPLSAPRGGHMHGAGGGGPSSSLAAPASYSPAAMSFLTGRPMAATIGSASMGVVTGHHGDDYNPHDASRGGPNSGSRGNGGPTRRAASSNGNNSKQRAAVGGVGPSSGSRESVVTATTRSASNKRVRNLLTAAGTADHHHSAAGTAAEDNRRAASRTRARSAALGPSPRHTANSSASALNGNATHVTASSSSTAAPSAHHYQYPTAAASSSSAAHGNGNANRAATTASPHEAWEVIKAQSVSADWSARSMAFVELSQLVDLNRLPPEHLGTAVLLATRHMNDTHYRVAVSATGALARLLPKASREYFECVELIMALHVTNLSSAKEPLRTAATVQLGALLQAFGPTNLQPALWRVINTSGAVIAASLSAGGSGSGAGGVMSSIGTTAYTCGGSSGGGGSGTASAVASSKVRLGAVEFLLHMVQSNKLTFAYASTMKPLMARLIGLFRKLTAAPPSTSSSSSSSNHHAAGLQSDNDCIRATSAIFATLYTASNETFCGLMNHLAGSGGGSGGGGHNASSSGAGGSSSSSSAAMADYRLVLKACEMLVPHLAQDCQRLRDGTRPLRHPEPSIASPFARQLQACSPAPPPPRNPNDHDRLGGGFGEFALAAAERALAPTFGEEEDEQQAAKSALAASRANPYNRTHQQQAEGDYGEDGHIHQRHQSGHNHSPARRASPSRGVGGGNNFSPSRYDASRSAHTDVGASYLSSHSPSKQQQQKKNLYDVLPRRTADALSKLEAVPTPLLSLMQAASLPSHAVSTPSQKVAAMEGAMLSLKEQPRLWSNRFREFFSHLILFTADHSSSEVRCMALECMVKVLTTKYLLPLCAGVLDEAMRCAVLNISGSNAGGGASSSSFLSDPLASSGAIEALQAATLLLRTICGDPSAVGTAAASEGYVGGSSSHAASRGAGPHHSYFGNNTAAAAGGGGGPISTPFSSYFEPPRSTSVAAAIGQQQPLHHHADPMQNDLLGAYRPYQQQQQQHSGVFGGGDPLSIRTASNLSTATAFGVGAGQQQSASSSSSLYPPECILDAAMVVLEENSEVGTLHKKGAMALFKMASLVARGVLQAANTSSPSHAVATAAAMPPLSHMQEVVLARFVPITVKAINSTHSEVRKQAVVTIVDWYAVSGPALLPYLTSLSTAQLKLVSIYYNRQYGHRLLLSSGGGGGMDGGTTSIDLISEMERFGIRARGI